MQYGRLLDIPLGEVFTAIAQWTNSKQQHIRGARHCLQNNLTNLQYLGLMNSGNSRHLTYFLMLTPTATEAKHFVVLSAGKLSNIANLCGLW